MGREGIQFISLVLKCLLVELFKRGMVNVGCLSEIISQILPSYGTKEKKRK